MAWILDSSIMSGEQDVRNRPLENGWLEKDVGKCFCLFTIQVISKSTKTKQCVAGCSKNPPSKAASPEVRGVDPAVHAQTEGLRTPLEGFFNTTLDGRGSKKEGEYPDYSRT